MSVKLSLFCSMFTMWVPVYWLCLLSRPVHTHSVQWALSRLIADSTRELCTCTLKKTGPEPRYFNPSNPLSFDILTCPPILWHHQRSFYLLSFLGPPILYYNLLCNVYMIWLMTTNIAFVWKNFQTFFCSNRSSRSHNLHSSICLVLVCPKLSVFIFWVHINSELKD